MTNDQAIAMVRNIVGEDSTTMTDDIIEVYLQLATGKILERLYPYNTEENNIPARYETLLCELAARLYVRRGAEGENSHEENGVNRAYADAGDEDILSRITPYAKVV